MSKKENPISKPIKKSIIQKDKEIVKEFKLNDENAIPFLFEYGKKKQRK